MKDSSVVYVCVASEHLLAEIETCVAGWQSVVLRVVEAKDEIEPAQLVIFDWQTYAKSPLVAKLKRTQCPWIVLSEAPSTEQELQVLAEGGADYLRAPFDSAVSRLRLHLHLNRKQAFDRLASLSVTDPLTGLYNRRKFDEEVVQCWKQSQREKTPCCMVLVDVDWFKGFNDRYGHLEGDQCLQQVAAVLAQCGARPRDIVARIGGEEFALLLPSTPLEGAQRVAERILKRLSRLDIPHESSPFGMVTVSLGVSEALPTGAFSAQWQRSADGALYQAKHNGRNQVVSVQMTQSAALQLAQ